MLPIECVVRGYLAGSGWKDYRATGDGLRPRAARPGCASRTGCPSRSSRRRRRRTTGHDENIDARAGGRARRRRALRARSSGSRSRSTASPPDYALARGIILADTKFEFGLDADGTARARRRGAHARLVPLLARRRVRARRRRSRRSTSSSCATTARRSAGTRRDPGPELPDDVVAGTRARYVEAFERLTGIAFDDYLADPEVVLR